MRFGRVVKIAGLVMACLCAGVARAQLQGHISMAKDTYMAGEPIYVHFEVTNTSSDPVQFVSSDPYVEECSGYHIEVASGPSVAHFSCMAGAVERCPSGNDMLAPGATLRQNILVNYAHEVSKPGDYEIHAIHTLNYGPATADLTAATGKNVFKYESRFQIHVTKADPDELKAIYAVYVRNLELGDPEIVREAERAIVSGAPPWLEGTIEGMVKSSSSREFALLGLRNLNTERSREELAQVFQNTQEFTDANLTAAKYLAQLGDKKYFPLLLEMAKKQDPDEGREYVLAAAELGGDGAVPFLRELANSKDAKVRTTAVMALGMTGSREAVPLLIAALKSSDGELRKAATNALTELTHRNAFADSGGSGDPPGDPAGQWASWWAEKGSDAKVFGPKKCGEE